MVTLSKIYTRTGDGGKTRLGDNSQVDKGHDRVEAYGCVDELNAALGLALLARGTAETAQLLQALQNDLFDLGADLCCPLVEGEAEGEKLRITAGQVEFIEREIDRVNADLEPLRSFVLPGGSPMAAWLHLARTICRRAERRVWSLAASEKLNEQVAIYLNRLADLFFVLARHCNGGGNGDVLWQPGLGAKEND